MLFASPEECEQAFYEALAVGDIEAMAELWLRDDDVCCVHPGSGRAVGYNAVRASWAAILSAGSLRIRTLARHGFESLTLAASSLIEEIEVSRGSTRQLVHVLAANTFVKTPAGWKMAMHLGTPAPQGQAVEAEGLPGTFH